MAKNNEIIYLLFIFLVSIDSKSASVLFYAISLKDHSDIKIQKEANRQIERFDTWISEVDGANGLSLIASVCQAAVHFYERSGVPIASGTDVLKDHVCAGNLKLSMLFLDQCFSVAGLLNKLHSHVYKDGDLLAEDYME